MRPVNVVAAGLFALVACAHLARLMYGWPVTVGTLSVPPWVSVGGVVVPGILAVLLWREGRRS